MSIFRDSRFWTRMLDKSIISFFNGALAVLTAGAVGIFDISYLEVLNVGGLSAAISISTSFTTAAGGIEDPSQRIITKFQESEGKHAAPRISGGKNANRES